MTENQKNAEDGWVLLGTKVPPHIGQLFDLLARQRGMKSYELLQLLINGFIAAAKHDGPLTPELRLLIDSLKLDVAFCKAFNFASPTARAEIAQMVLILQQPGRNGFGMVMIDRPWMGEATMTYCVDSILERVTEVSMDDLYKELRQIGIVKESNSIRETLMLMCEEQAIRNLNREDEEEMPGLGNWHEFGKEVEFGQKFKRKPHLTPDSLSSQLTIQWTDDDRELAEYEAKGWEGEHRQHGDDLPEGMTRPFDQEW